MIRFPEEPKSQPGIGALYDWLFTNLAGRAAARAKGHGLTVDEAEDAASESMQTLIRRIREGWRPEIWDENSVTNFFYGIVKNVTLDIVRKRRPSEEFDEDCAPGRADPDLSDAMEYEQALAKLRAEFARVLAIPGLLKPCESFLLRAVAEHRDALYPVKRVVEDGKERLYTTKGNPSNRHLDRSWLKGFVRISNENPCNTTDGASLSAHFSRAKHKVFAESPMIKEYLS